VTATGVISGARGSVIRGLSDVSLVHRADRGTPCCGRCDGDEQPPALPVCLCSHCAPQAVFTESDNDAVSRSIDVPVHRVRTTAVLESPCPSADASCKYAAASGIESAAPYQVSRDRIRLAVVAAICAGGALMRAREFTVARLTMFPNRSRMNLYHAIYHSLERPRADLFRQHFAIRPRRARSRRRLR
jgi:hypothetical protein